MGMTSRRTDTVASEHRRPRSRGADMVISALTERLPAEAELRRFVQLAGGERAVIAVISCAATNPAGTGETYAARFRQLGAREASWLRVWQRCDANSAEVVAALRRATGIFVADGDRSRLQRLLADTRATETILQRSDEGAVVAGISAGASIVPPLGEVESNRHESKRSDAGRRSDLAELGIGAGLLAELGAEQYASHAVEWSGF